MSKGSYSSGYKCLFRSQEYEQCDSDDCSQAPVVHVMHTRQFDYIDQNGPVVVLCQVADAQCQHAQMAGGAQRHFRISLEAITKPAKPAPHFEGGLSRAARPGSQARYQCAAEAVRGWPCSPPEASSCRTCRALAGESAPVKCSLSKQLESNHMHIATPGQEPSQHHALPSASGLGN